MLQAGFTRNHTLLFILFLTAVSYLFARRPTMSSPSTTQTALIVSSIGGRITSTSSWPIPRPGPKQVQIRVTVAGLNPHDQKSRDAGLLIKDSLPAIIGNDITGVVTAIGEQVTRFSVGDRVVSQSQLAYEQKALQQFAVLEEDFAAKIPHPFSDHDAATLPTNALAALISLFDPTSGLGIPAPWSSSSSRSSFDYAATTLLIVGGGSNCGRFGVQFAKMAGIGRIVVVGGEEEELKKWGATVVLDRHGGDAAVIHRIRQVVGDDLVYVFDAINLPEGQHVGISALSSSQRGKLARLRSSVGGVDETKIVGEKKAGYELKNVLGISQLKTDTVRPFWERLEGYLQDGSVVPLKYQVIDGLDADKVNELLDRYRDGKKVVQTHFRVSE